MLTSKLDVCLPEWVTLDNELAYLVHFKRAETGYYIATSYISAHESAQRKVRFAFKKQNALSHRFSSTPGLARVVHTEFLIFLFATYPRIPPVSQLSMFFGDDPMPDTPEEVTLCLESSVNVEIAREVTDNINKEIVDLIKTKLVAEHLVDFQINMVHRLVVQGVLTSRESEKILHGIHEDKHHLDQERKKQARELTENHIEREKEARGQGFKSPETQAPITSTLESRNSSANRLQDLLEGVNPDSAQNSRRSGNPRHSGDEASQGSQENYTIPGTDEDVRGYI